VQELAGACQVGALGRDRAVIRCVLFVVDGRFSGRWPSVGGHG
jgi:hypothetical protein